jgi:6-methylsalicylate decarboxylase
MTAPTVDVHQHLWPEPFVSALSRRRAPPSLRAGRLRTEDGEYDVDLALHEPAARLARLDRDGTDVAIVSLQPTLGLDGLPPEERAALVDAYHAGILEVTDASGGRVVALAYESADDRFAGTIVSAASFAAGRCDEVLAELEASGRFVFVHPGPGGRPPTGMPGWWPEVVDYAGAMYAAYVAWLVRGAAAYPNLKVVLAILAGGAPVQLERLRSRGVEVRPVLQRNVFFDTASYGPRALELVLATFGVRRLVFGSDLPVLDPGVGLRALSELGAAVSDAVRRENPSLLLA